MNGTASRCPDCTAELTADGQRCLRCGLPLTGPAAAELWQVEQALADNQAQRRALLARRETLLGYLRSRAQRFLASPYPAYPPAQRAASAPTPAPAGRPEASPQSVQNLLLALGGLLLAVSAVVFTVVAWGRFGIGGRAAILGTFTAIALATPPVLLRRRLSATAETIALVGLVLMALDGYAAYRVGAFGLDDVNGYGYSAAVLAVMAATAVGYSRLVQLRLLPPVGIGLAQPVVPLAAAAMHSTITGSAGALAVVAGLNVAIIAAIRRPPARLPERVIATICAAAAACYAIPVALVLTFTADNPWRAAGVLALTGAVATGAALVSTPIGVRAFLAGGGILIVATAAIGIALPQVGSAGVIAPALAGALVAVGAIRAPRMWRLGGLGAASVLLVAGSVVVLPSVVHALFGPFTWLGAAWRGAGGAARTSVDAVPAHSASWFGETAALPAVVLLAGGAAVVAYAVAGRRGAAAVLALGTIATTAVAPVALDLSRSAGLIVQGAIATALCLMAVRLTRPLLFWSAGGAGLFIGALTLAGCLAQQPSTLVGLTVAMTVFAFAAALARAAQPGAAAAGLLAAAATAQAAAVVLAGGHDAAAACWAMLGVAAIAAGCVHVAEGRLPHHARALTVASALACVAAASSALAWVDSPGVYLAAAGGIVVAAALRRPLGPERHAFLASGGIPLAGALITVAEPLLQAYLLPYAWVAHGWSNAPSSSRAALAPGLPWSGDALVPAVLAVIAVAGAAALAVTWGRAVAARAAVPSAALTAGLLPLAFDLPWPVALITLGVLGCALLAAAALGRAASLVPPWISGPSAAVLAATMLAWSLATAPATVLALTATAAATLLAAISARTRGLVLVATTASASAAVLAAVASTLAAGQPARLAAFAALAVAAGLAALAAVLRAQRRIEALCCEGVAAVGALLGVVLSAGRPLTLSIALAVTGLVVGTTALRPDRRASSYAGTALVILGSWVRLADLGVTAPEAYSVPVAAAALVIGWLRWRQRQVLSSWLVFGPGLATGLLPSLAAVVLDAAEGTSPNAVRPLALGTAALVIVLVGGWQRLQAPLLIGGGVLAAVALNELGPAVAEAVAMLPRWVPLGLAGLFLLGIGATYERRRGDLRKVRDAVARMS